MSLTDSLCSSKRVYSTDFSCCWIHPLKTAKNIIKTPFLILTKWYFRPKWKFNIWTDFLPAAKRQKIYSNNNTLIINQIQMFQKSSKNAPNDNFSRILNIQIIFWLLIRYNKIYRFYPQTPLQIHSFFSFFQTSFPNSQLYTY